MNGKLAMYITRVHDHTYQQDPSKKGIHINLKKMIIKNLNCHGSPFATAYSELCKESKERQMQITGGENIDTTLRKKMKVAQRGLVPMKSTFFNESDLSNVNTIGTDMALLMSWVSANTLDLETFANTPKEQLHLSDNSTLDKVYVFSRDKVALLKRSQRGEPEKDML